MRYMGKDAFTLSGGKKRPRVHHDDFLAFVRSLPCIICSRHTTGEAHAAHIRFANLYAGKAMTGARKPDDVWVVPLCVEHHVFGKDAQHAGFNEKAWWNSHNVDPLYVAALLWLHYTHDDRIAAEQVAMHARELRL
jgi:hypothetical protein